MAFIANIPQNRDPEAVRQYADSIIVEKFKPKTVEVSTQNPNNIEIKEVNDEDKVQNLANHMR